VAETFDIVIVGSGGGAVPAALVAKTHGKSAAIIEKQAVFGGSTSFSGGVWWVPDNPLLAEAGIADSYAQGRLYLDSLNPTPDKASSRERTDAFLKAAPRMVEFLRSFGMKFRRPYDLWPDYHDELPGGLPEGRSLLAEPFDLKLLGDWRNRLSIYGPLAHMPLGAEEFTTLFLMKRGWKGKLKALKYAGLMARDFILGRQTVANGAAIQGRMLEIALREKIDLRLSSPVEEFLIEGGKIVGVVIVRDGHREEIRARDGVIVNVGGYSHNTVFRQSHGDAPIVPGRSSANPGDTGELIEAMMELGAATAHLDTAWWVVTSQNIDGSWPEGVETKDGGHFRFLHHLDLSLPYSIMVDQTGRRFCDEAGSYMEIGERMLARQRTSGKAIPAWVIFDARHRRYYPWGAMPPGKTPKSWIESGYMKKATTLDELAAACGIDAGGLRAEVARFNGFCKTGIDPDFNRGARAFDRAHGDPSIVPNPNLAPIEQGPFYAVAMYPADVGTAGGVVTDEFARVLRDDGTAFDGLYAVGNSAAPVFGRTYPGAGASIAASFTFGYVAALHCARSNQLDDILG
jgi:3-oxosteroid 1-dehydrogenase